MTHSELLQREWHIDWEGEYSLFSVFIPLPHIRFAEVFDIPYPTFLLVQKQGYSKGLFDKQEYENVGNVLAGRLEDGDFRADFCNTFKRVADEAEMQLSYSPPHVLEQFDEFVRLHKEYLTYQQATKIAYHIEAVHRKDPSILADLEEARVYSEKFFPHSAKTIGKLAEHISAIHPHYSTDLIGTLSVEEIELYRASGALPDVSILTARFNRSGVLVDTQGWRFIPGATIDELEAVWVRDVTEIQGDAAYYGKATGRCRIIRDPRGAVFEEGDILIAGMTDPNFLPLIARAGAIITDGGGMLCHAAIVSREMRKPCIIGTKISTRVLQDGDVVEVDATNGIIRKIS